VVRDDRVSATLAGAALPAVLAEIARQAGAELGGETVPAREITLELRRVAVDEALQRLLGARSFTLTYGPDGRLKRILIGGGPSGGSAATTTATPRATSAGAHTVEDPPGGPAPTPEEISESIRGLNHFLQGDSAVPVRGRLAEALATGSAPFREVWEAALQNPDPRVRALARRAAIKALAADPEAHEAWVAFTTMLPDDALVTILRAGAGLDARELAIACARYGRSPEVARTMRRALDQMRAQPIGPPHGG
jgi:hypothetical protein